MTATVSTPGATSTAKNTASAIAAHLPASTVAAVEVRDLGEQDSKPVFRTRVEWYCNVVDIHPRCVARLYDISDATAIA